MKIIECLQLSPEWWAARRGIPTASEFGSILTPKQMKLAAGADGYIAELIGDLCSSLYPTADVAKSFAMRHGNETEAEARDWYAFQEDQDVQQVGFCLTDDSRFGMSPDGLVGDNGLLELKCPQPKTHAQYLLAGELPSEYRAQVHGQLIVSGRAWVDFVSYCPGKWSQFRIRVTPDDYTLALAAALDQFHQRFTEALERIRSAK